MMNMSGFYKIFLITINVFYHPARITYGYTVFGDRTSNYTAGTNHAIFPNGDTWQ